MEIEQKHENLKILTPAIIAILVLVLIILGAKFFPGALNINSAKSITGTISFLDEYQRYIEIQTTGGNARLWRVTIKGVQIEKKNIAGQITKGALSDLKLGSTITINTQDTGLNKDNDTINPTLITADP